MPAARRSGNGVLAFAGLMSFLWLSVAAAAIYLVSRHESISALGLAGLAGLAAGVAAPLSVIWLAALVLVRRGPAASLADVAHLEAARHRFADAAAQAKGDIASLEALLDRVGERVESVRASVSAQTAALSESATDLERRSNTVSAGLNRDREMIAALIETLTSRSMQARAELADVSNALPAAEQQAIAIHAALSGGATSARRQISELEALLSSLMASQDAGQARAIAASDTLRTAITGIDEAGSAAAGRLEQRASALSAAVDSAMGRTAEALEQTRAGVEAQIGALVGAVEQARHVLVDLGSEASSEVSARLTALVDASGQLSAALRTQEERGLSLVESHERNFSVLDAKLANAAQSAGAVLSQLGGQLDGVRDHIHALATPLSGTAEHVRLVGQAVAGVQAAAHDATTLLSDSLPDVMARSGEAAGKLRDLMTALTADTARLGEAISEATRPAGDGRDMIAAIITDLGERQASLQGTMGKIRDNLHEAREIVTGIEAGADTAALSAATRLVEAMNRVREVAGQTESVMRTTLEKVVAEAGATLEASSRRTLESAFSKPVTEKLGELDALSSRTADAARATSEQLTRQLLNLLETANTVETHMAQADRKLETASQDELARRSSLIIESLNSVSIDITRMLATDIADSSWRAYLKGDRSIFTRRAVRLVDGKAGRAMMRQFEADPAFRDVVQRYIADFEALMRRVGSDRDSEALLLALLSSDVGKLYVALAEVLERLRR